MEYNLNVLGFLNQILVLFFLINTSYQVNNFKSQSHAIKEYTHIIYSSKSFSIIFVFLPCCIYIYIYIYIYMQLNMIKITIVSLDCVGESCIYTTQGNIQYNSQQVHLSFHYKWQLYEMQQ